MTANQSQRTFERNLAALSQAQPALAERLAWPVDGAHVDPGPPARYLHHKTWVPLGIAEQGGPEPPRGAAEALVIGVGIGDLLARVLALLPDARVTAWDRDPWLLRLALGRLDVAERIAAGGLALALGPDLLDVGAAAWAARIVHPLLGELYRRDVAFAERAGGVGAVPRTAVLATGGLLVESLGDALERAGYRVWPLEIRRLSLEELDHQMARLAPELLVAVNYTNGLAELAARHGARLCAWEIDPTTTAPRLDAGVRGAADAGIFTWRARDLGAFRAAGFRSPEHLPIGADTTLRAPVELDRDERARYAAPVSYVGASLMRNAGEFRERFLARWAETGRAHGEGVALLDEALFLQRSNPTRFLIPALLDERAPELRAAAAGGEDPALLCGELAAAEKRLTYVANLGRLGVHAWGDAGWQPLERHGVRYRGPAGHGAELTKIYNATTVNVDVGRIYQNDIVTLRTFDVLACGAFALVEHTKELEELFDVGREVVSYRTLNELVEKAAHYAKNPDEAAEVAARGLAAVRARHTVDLRLAHMLRGLSGKVPGTV